ncbi:MAG: flagellar protein FlaG [Peptococcaceae bacterium]|nr:flagellar protein FlaG [Peptococcaceae bacterium]
MFKVEAIGASGMSKENNREWRPLPTKQGIRTGVGNTSAGSTADHKAVYENTETKAADPTAALPKVEEMNRVVSAMDMKIQFVLHEDTNRYIVQVIDPWKDEVMREIPTHEFLDMVAEIQKYVGIMLDRKV